MTSTREIFTHFWEELTLLYSYTYRIYPVFWNSGGMNVRVIYGSRCLCIICITHIMSNGIIVPFERQIYALFLYIHKLYIIIVTILHTFILLIASIY